MALRQTLADRPDDYEVDQYVIETVMVERYGCHLRDAAVKFQDVKDWPPAQVERPFEHGVPLFCEAIFDRKIWVVFSRWDAPPGRVCAPPEGGAANPVGQARLRLMPETSAVMLQCGEFVHFSGETAHDRGLWGRRHAPEDQTLVGYSQASVGCGAAATGGVVCSV